ncbi:hypothetical protein [Verrucomicrobium sp. GAS474]|nr:hypothetical protein [Verrucomicrobium sp. GAS474]
MTRRILFAVGMLIVISSQHDRLHPHSAQAGQAKATTATMVAAR